MGQIIFYHPSRTQRERIRTPTSNSRQRGIGRFEDFFTTNDVDYQLVPPHCHRRNAAERAIGTFKEHFVHFVAGLSSVDPSFPLHFWDILLP
jgi:hypothetical protein